MKISIAMATYNGAQYIQEQLQSFADQTRQPDELIITDDCSTDQTEAIVREFAKTAPFTVGFHRNEKNLGYCGNFNAALTKATGDLVFLSDQDDVWFPEKIEHMSGIAECNPDALVLMNDAALTDGNLNSVGLTKLGQIRSAGLSLDDFVMGCCCAVRRELLEMALPIPEGFTAHDSWIVRIADALDRRLVDDRIMQLYRRHHRNESKFIANRTTKVTRFTRLLQGIRKLSDVEISTKEMHKIDQEKIFLEGIEMIILREKGARREAFEILAKESGKWIDWAERRAVFRQLSLAPRIVQVLKYMLSGGYRVQGGTTAFVKDLAG
jgi:glycosyltransferase involved in cell wall biosynthesis